MFNSKHVLRILVVAMAVVMLMSISVVSAEEAYNFNTHSPMNAATRSLILPGWGQFFNGQPTKGLVFAGAELIVIGTAFMTYSSANSTYNDYDTQRTATLYDDYSSKIDTANMFVYAAAAIWVGNVIDAYLSGGSEPTVKSKKSTTIKKSSKKKKVEVEPEEQEEEQIEEEQPQENENETTDEEENDESRLPTRGFYLQAKGLQQLGIAYRYTF